MDFLRYGMERGIVYATDYTAVFHEIAVIPVFCPMGAAVIFIPQYGKCRFVLYIQCFSQPIEILPVLCQVMGMYFKGFRICAFYFLSV